jgi:hypothetical protein
MESNHHVLNHMNITCRDQIKKKLNDRNNYKMTKKRGVKEVTL